MKTTILFNPVRNHPFSRILTRNIALGTMQRIGLEKQCAG
jgi:hypothetical protein